MTGSLVRYSEGRILELDGFRALAVSMVIFEHMVDGWPLPSSATAWMPSALRFVLAHGWLGVDLFFVLSGFLITGILVGERDDPRYLENFYGRRALRILPLVVVCIFIWWLTYAHPYGRYLLLALIFCANLDVIFHVPTPHGPGVLWSLAVEEHFYLLWPLAVRLMTRPSLLAAAIAIVVLSPPARWLAVSYGISADHVYQFSWYRFDGLAVGAILAIWVRSAYFTRRHVWIIVAGWLFLIGLASAVTIPYGVLQAKTAAAEALRYTQAQGLFAGAMALAIAYRGSIFLSPLRSNVAQTIAKLSYCLYLVHLSLGDLYYWTLGRLGIDDTDALGGTGALVMRAMIIICVSVVIAALSQRYLEGPFMSLRGRFARKEVKPSVRGRRTGF